MARRLTQAEPVNRQYRAASAIDASTEQGLCELIQQRLERARNLLDLKAREDRLGELIPLLDGTYGRTAGGDQVYFNEALPILEDLIFSTFPDIPSVDVQEQQPGQEVVSQGVRALADTMLASPLCRVRRAMISCQWDEILWAVGWIKTTWKGEEKKPHQASADTSVLLRQQALAQGENAQPLLARVGEDDDDAAHVVTHEPALTAFPPGVPEGAALAAHVNEHYLRLGRDHWSYPLVQRVNPTHFLYDPDAEEWEERQWEAELCTERIADLERMPGIRNLTPGNCPTVDEFDVEESRAREDESFDFAASRTRVWKFHERLTGRWIWVPAKQGNEVKPILDIEWPYGNLDIYRPLVHRPVAGRVHGLATLPLLRPLLLKLAQVNAAIIRAIKKAASYGRVFAKGSLSVSEINELNDTERSVKFVNAQALAQSAEWKPPTNVGELVTGRELILAEVRRLVGLDIMEQGGDTPHVITATEAQKRAQYRDSRVDRRQEVASQMLSWVASNIVGLYRRFGYEEITLRALGPAGVEMTRLRPEDIPEDLVMRVRVGVSTAAKRSEQAQSATMFLAQLGTMAPGMFDPVRVLIDYARKLGVDNPERFFVRPGTAPTVPAPAGMPGQPGPPAGGPPVAPQPPQSQGQSEPQPAAQPAAAAA